MNNTNSIKKSLKNDIAFVGLTHLGLVFSICLSSLRKNILALDTDQKILSQLSKGIVKTPEPGLQKLLLKHRRNLNFSSDFKLLSEISLIFISLDTPTDKPFYLKKLGSLIDQVITHISDNSVLVIASQIPVGFTRKLKNRIERKRPKLKFKLYYFLNTLIIGDSVNRFLKPERIVIGLDIFDELIDPLTQGFLNLFKAPVFKMSYESAELTKSAINLYLASSIITSNTIADFCEITGANINEIIPALKSDRRIGPYAYLKPTLRISGGHLERELVKLKSLSSEYKISSGIVDPLIKLNESRINWLVKKIKEFLKDQSIKTITLWGLAYKKDTNSTDNAVSMELIKKLSKKFNFQIYDPEAILPKNLSGYKRFRDKYHALENSDILIVLTEWEEFSKADYQKIIKSLKNPLIIDCVNIMKEGMPVIRMGI